MEWPSSTRKELGRQATAPFTAWCARRKRYALADRMPMGVQSDLVTVRVGIS